MRTGASRPEAPRPDSKADGAGSRHTAWIVLGLLAAVLATYAEVGGFEFVRYDDLDYVRDNPAVNRGLSWPGLRWAFGATHASNWHPLTWIAHMLDVELFGLAPGGHHWSNVLLHALAAALCFLALRALSARTWPAALVAAFFALHPLRVESVAWVSEKKDVLAGCAFFALLWAYARYARAPDGRRYALVLLALVLGLLAKPMLVSAPFVLLLLDVWPLARTRPLAAAPAAPAVLVQRRALDKLPLFLLAGVSCAVTVWCQRAGGSLNTLEALPLAARLANAPLAVVRYLGHFVWPSGLAYFYPHAGLVDELASPWSGAALAALAFVLVLCALAFVVRRRLPALFVGWFWFLGMLVPVIGIVQVGEQALADRYAYLPAVGLQLALVFGLAELAQRRARLRAPLCAAAGVALLACGLASARQARAWHDSESLFRHALALTTHNYPAWHGLANELAEQGHIAEARAGYEQALAIHPRYGPALYGLGLLEQRHGDPERALELYRRATEALPGLAAAHLNLGSLLARRGEVVAAAQAFERVLALVPAHPDAHFNLAQLLFVNGRPAEAREHLERVVQVVPAHTPAWEKLGEVHLRLEQRAEARAALERAVRDPSRADAARLLAELLLDECLHAAPEAALRDAARALELARRAAAATERRDPRALEVLAAALAANGEFPRAAEVQEEALPLLAPAQAGRARERAAAYRRGELSDRGR